MMTCHEIVKNWEIIKENLTNKLDFHTHIINSGVGSRQPCIYISLSMT